MERLVISRLLAVFNFIHVMSLFGASSQPSTGGGFTFGTPSSTGTAFGAFGASQAGNTPNKLFGTTSFGTGFGAATTTASGSVFGFGAKTTASSSFGMPIEYPHMFTYKFIPFNITPSVMLN